MRTIAKKTLDKILHPLGLNVERYFGAELALNNLLSISKENNIDLLLDIGANTGQYTRKMIQLGFNQPIVSFEPLSSAYTALEKNAAAFANWRVFDRCAIGNFDGEIEINISKNSYSSSILKVNKLHLEAAPMAACFDKEIVAIRKLDSISNQLDGSAILLKMDTQGYEDKVLQGALEKVLPRVKIIQLELSLLPLYDGLMTFDKMLSFLESLSFKPLFYSQGFTDRTNDHIQQLEGFFIRYVPYVK